MLVAHSTGMFTVGRKDLGWDCAAQPVRVAISSMLTHARPKFRGETVVIRFISPLQSQTMGDWTWYPRPGDVAIRRKTEKSRKCLIGATLLIEFSD
jgi:hypothetical protein